MSSLSSWSLANPARIDDRYRSASTSLYLYSLYLIYLLEDHHGYWRKKAPEMRMLFIFLMVFAASVAEADELTGRRLFQYCSDANKASPNGISCSAYIAGFVEGLLIGKLLPESGLTFCPPEGLSGGDARLIVQNWLRQHPKALDDTARMASMAALVTAYPCDAKNSN